MSSTAKPNANLASSSFSASPSSSILASPRKRARRSPIFRVLASNSPEAYHKSIAKHASYSNANDSSDNKAVADFYGENMTEYCNEKSLNYMDNNDEPTEAHYCVIKSDSFSSDKSSLKFHSDGLALVSPSGSPVAIGTSVSSGNEIGDAGGGASSSSDSISLSGSCSESDSRQASPVLSPPSLSHAHQAALSSLINASATPGVNLFAAVAAAASAAAGGAAEQSSVQTSLLSSNSQRQAALALSFSMGLSGRMSSSAPNCSSSLDTPPVIVGGGGLPIVAESRSLLATAGRNASNEAVGGNAAATATTPFGGAAHSSPRVPLSSSPPITSSLLMASSSAAAVAPLNVLPPASSTPWPPLQDFDNLAAVGFDGSLSGLSDLAGTSTYMGDMLELVKRQSSHSAPATSSMCNLAAENYFQFILMAPTSSAVRLNEEPLTYLNQGQSYEIKCKRLNFVDSAVPSRLYTSVVRVGFHDRRQKFQEKELLTQWKQLHNCNKIIDADIPMSFNVFNTKTDLPSSHIEFTWDSSKNASVFIKINCISTEFTAHKHGGEKGVPFRLQVDTYAYSDCNQHMEIDPLSRQLHSAYAQIKVFKTKGADRKIKTDRERAEKRLDKEKYQPSYEYTVMIETFPIADSTSVEADLMGASPACLPIKVEQQSNSCNSLIVNNGVKLASDFGSPSLSVTAVGPLVNGNVHSNGRDSVISSQGGTNSPSPSADEHYPNDSVSAETSPNETSDWLRRQRFGYYAKLFSSFSGVDLLRMSREDLIKLCGMADGIRLFNALQHKPLQPKLSLYMCVPGAPAYHAVFLKALTLNELVRKVCGLIQVQPSQIYDVYCQGPDGINVHVNDEVVQNMPDKSRFTIDAMKCGEESDCYRILLKSSGETPP